MLRIETKSKGTFHVKRKITVKHKPSAISYKAIADAIHKTLKENGQAERRNKYDASGN